jgi:nucleoside 2-deoxyribosyltransferase
VSRVYVAGPLGFSAATQGYYGDVLLPAVRAAGFEPLDPWADPDAPAEFAAAHDMVDPEERRAAFRRINTRLASANEAMIRAADAVLAILDGPDVDSGTAAEVGFAAALGKPCVGLRLDFRRTGDNEGATVNLQVEHWLVTVEATLGDALVKLRHATRDAGGSAPPDDGVRK